MFSLKIYDNDFESYRKFKSEQELRRAVDTLPDLSDAVEGEYSKEPVIFVTSALEWEERHDIVDERLLESLPGGRTTYRLTPQHFAWLHSRMSNAQAAYSAGRLGDEQWDEMRRRFNRLQERSVSLFGKDSLQQALRTFSPSTYKLPGASTSAKPLPAQHADSSAAAPIVVRRLPSSCPHTEEELIRKAGEFPNLVACPVGVPPWWWVAKTKCATNCPGHPDCIRNLYWSEEWLRKIEEKSNEKIR